MYNLKYINIYLYFVLLTFVIDSFIGTTKVKCIAPNKFICFTLKI